MKRVFQTAISVVASMASYKHLKVAIASVILLLPFLATAQASQTTVERVGSTNVYHLIYTQNEDDPTTLAGVEFYVVVSGSSPSISLAVPDDTWLFGNAQTTLTVGTPIVTGSTYKFPIYAWRNDNDPQDGEGHYLNVTATDGIVIAVEDFPGKTGSSSTEVVPAPTTFREVIAQAKELTIWNLNGTLAAQFQDSNLRTHAMERWKSLPHGIYLIEACLQNQNTVRLKLYR